MAQALDNFYTNVAAFDNKIQVLRTTIKSFVHVLESMQKTLKEEDIKSSLQATGHINNHWERLSITIKDGQKTLEKLQAVLEQINPNGSILSNAQAKIRFDRVTSDIMMYQEQIQRYKETIHLSLEMVIV